MASIAKHDWPMVSLLEAVDDVTRGHKKVPKSAYEEVGSTPIVDQSMDFICGYTDAIPTLVSPPYIVFGDHTRELKYIDFEFVPGADGVKVMKPAEGIDPKFLYYYLKAHPVQALGYSRHFKLLKELSIPLPPLAEQRRIAAVLDEVDDSLARVNQSLGDLLQLKQELFTDLFLRIERESTAIGEYLESTQYGTSDKANENVGIPVLRMGNVSYNGEIDFSDLKYVELGIKDREKYSLKAGDLLFNRTNSKDLVGKTAVVPELQEEYTYAGYLIRCRVNDKAVPEYISGFLNSVLGKKILRNTAKAIVGMANINANELKRLPIPQASLDEQQEFASLTSRIDDVESQMKRQRKLLQELQESLSTRAFQGEL